MIGDVLRGVVPLLPFFCLALGLSALFGFTLLWIHQRWKPSKREEASRLPQKNAVSRFGGVGLLLAFVISLLLWPGFQFSPTIGALLSGGVLILFFGILDDIRPISWWWQLAFQLLLGGLLVFLGLKIEIMQGPFGGTVDFREWFSGMPLVILLLWLLLVMNAVNWLDGLDGLLGSVVCIGFGTLTLVSFFPEVRQPGLAGPSSILLGATLAFLFFNWPPGRIIAGTVGSYFLGFALAVLAISAGAKIATTVLVLIIPILDALFVLWERWRSGTSLFHPDGRHLHYRLRELGWSEKQIAVLYSLITLGMALLALSTQTLGKLLVFLGATLGLTLLSVLVQGWSQKIIPRV